MGGELSVTGYLAGIIAAIIAALATYFAARRTSHSQIEQVKDKALIEVFSVVRDERTKAEADLLLERQARESLSGEVGTLKTELAYLKGAHELLLRLQCPLAEDGTCPVFQKKAPPKLAVT